MANELTLEIEDGSIVDDANSYGDVAGADAYHKTRLSKASKFWLQISPSDQKIAYLIDAARRMDLLPWLGRRMREVDGRELPRSGLYDRAGYAIASDSIPQCVIDLQYDTAANLAYDGCPEDNDGGEVRSITIGNTGVVYASPQRTRVFSSSALAQCGHLLRRHGRVERVG